MFSISIKKNTPESAAGKTSESGIARALPIVKLA